ncbi:sigma-70 family RNA polymerase sigma factor [Amycolatopsis sp. NPDC003861]
MSSSTVTPATSMNAESLVNRSSVGTRGARMLAERARADDVASVLDRATFPPTPPPLRAPEPEEYRRLEELPRPQGRLGREHLDPLLREAGTGNPAAIKAVMTLIEPVVVRYCRGRMGGQDLSYLAADDVAQEACLAILKALPKYQATSGPFLYLVRAIAANKVADAHRTVARDRSDPVPEPPEQPLTGGDPAQQVLDADLGQRLQGLITRLPRVQQEILILRIVVGLSGAETAEALGISPGNVRVSQYRALTRLRKMVSTGGGSGR